MWNEIVAIVFSALLGLVSLGVAVWQIVTLQVIQSLDNIFLTLCALLLAVIGFGYLAMILAPVFSKSGDTKKKS
jgi:hypothetical protein